VAVAFDCNNLFSSIVDVSLRLGESQPMGDGGMAMPELLSAALERIKQMEGQLAEKGSSQSTTGPRPSLKRSTQLDSSAEKDLDGISKMLWCLRNSWFVFECIRYTSNEGFFFNISFVSNHNIGHTDLQPLQEILPDRQSDEPFAASASSPEGSDVGKGETGNGSGADALVEKTKPVETKPSDTSLEELNAMILKNRSDRADELPKQSTPSVPGEVVNWVTHKKEGMRLKRLMEESSEGRKFPHMQEMWCGSAADSWFWKNHLLL